MLLLLSCLTLPSTPTTSGLAPINRAGLPPTQLRAVHVARITMPLKQVVAGGDRKGELQGLISAYLVEHPQGNVLIDTAFGRRTKMDPSDYPGKLVLKFLGDFRMGTPMVDALPEIGLGAQDIAHVLLTHTHYDHVGGLQDFPDAEVHLTPTELQYGLNQRSNWSEPLVGRPVTPIVFTQAPYGPFLEHLDLYGDGSIIVLPSPGHTPGSVMVLVNLPETSVLIMGDAAWSQDNWTEPLPKGGLARTLVDTDWEQGMDTLWRVNAWARAWPELLVLTGHDGRNEDLLPAWPQPMR